MTIADLGCKFFFIFFWACMAQFCPSLSNATDSHLLYMSASEQKDW